MYRDRLDHLVHFPLEDLDLSEFIEGPKDNPLYDLYAVSVSPPPFPLST